MYSQNLLHHDFCCHAPTLAHGFQEVNAFSALTKVEDGMTIHAVFKDLAACDVVNLNNPLACAEIEVESAVRGIGKHLGIGGSLFRNSCKIDTRDKRYRFKGILKIQHWVCYRILTFQILNHLKLDASSSRNNNTHFLIKLEK